MKTFAALLVGCCVLCSGPVRSEVIDLSKITCKQFFDTHKGDVNLVLAWLSGYSREENDPPVFDADEFAADARKLAEYCAAHPAASMTTAAEEIFAD